MRLSEAMRIGAAKRPQTCEGFYFDKGCSCALGAIYEASHSYNDDKTKALAIEATLIARYPELNNVVEGIMIINHIIYYNDTLGMNRDLIAGWLEERGY